MTLFDSEYDAAPPRNLPARRLNDDLMPFNPAADGLWPPTLAMEIALQAQPLEDVCEAYGIDREHWNMIRHNPAFINELRASVEELRRDGAAFRVRARMQATELLKESWRLIHDPGVAHNVRADLIKFTINASGLNAGKEQAAAAAAGGGFMINVNIR